MKSQRKGKLRLPPFVAIDWAILNGQAYKKLTHSSRACLPYWLGKPKKLFSDPEYYEIEFIFPYAEAARYGFARATFSRIIRDLVDIGFVDPVSKGGLRGDGKSCNKFSLSNRWREYGKQAFKGSSWNEFIPKK